jgi:hypothetical protein
MRREWCVDALADVRLRDGRGDNRQAEKKLVKLDKLSGGVWEMQRARGSR